MGARTSANKNPAWSWHSSLQNSIPVYEAQNHKIKVSIVKDTPIGKEVIVKQVKCESEEEVRRVLNEGRIAQESQKHSNICQCIEVVEERAPDGQLYVFLVMPRMPIDLQKETERRSTAREPWPEPKLWEITKDLVSAFAFLQRKGIAHRDIKPANILLDPSGKVKICDFGFAKDIDLNNLQTHTLLGTVLYFSPSLRRAYIGGEEERKHVQHNVFKSDVYSLGVTLLHLMRLDYPKGLTDLRNLQRTVDNLLSGIQGYSPALIEVVWRMLRVEQDFRPDFLRLDAEFNHLLPFADDERITQEPASISFPEGLEFTAKCGLAQVRVCHNMQEEVPCMVHVKAPSADPETLEKLRKGVDFVCVIDISGSMAGSLIQLVQETLKRLTQLLKEVDRVSIVTFNDTPRRICPLTVCNPEGKAKLLGQIANLTASGNTNIISGFQMGVDTVSQRRYRNQVTTLLLFSGGQDTTDRNVVTECMSTLQQIISDQTVTVHTLGYGTQIDSELLIGLAKHGRGALHPVRSEEDMRDAFAMILGSATSVVAKEITIRLRVKDGPVPCEISKIYAKELDGDYYYLPEIVVNQSKDFIFLIKPAAMSLSAPKKLVVLKADITYQESDGTSSNSSLKFQIKFVPWEGTAEPVREPSVYVNWSRVMGADSLREAKRLVDQGRYQAADKVLSGALELLHSNGYQDHPIVAAVIRDIVTEQKLNSSDTTWIQSGGAAHFASTVYSHYSQGANIRSFRYVSPEQESSTSWFSTLSTIPEAEEYKSPKK